MYFINVFCKQKNTWQYPKGFNGRCALMCLFRLMGSSHCWTNKVLCTLVTVWNGDVCHLQSSCTYASKLPICWTQFSMAATDKYRMVARGKVGKEGIFSQRGASEFALLALKAGSAPGISDSQWATEVSSEMQSPTGAHWKTEGSSSTERVEV